MINISTSSPIEGNLKLKVTTTNTRESIEEIIIAYKLRVKGCICGATFFYIIAIKAISAEPKMQATTPVNVFTYGS